MLKHATRRVGFALLAAALGVACALVVSACGSSGSTSPTTTTTTSTSTTSATASFTAYQTCLTQHGVTGAAGFGGGFRGRGGTGATGARGVTGGFRFRGGTGPTGRRGPTLSAKEQQAIQACASLRPAGGFRGGGFTSTNPQFQQFESCLQQHGVTGTGGFRGGGSSPAAQAAVAACRSLLPTGGFGGGFGGAGAGAGGSTNPAFGRLQACLRQHGIQPGAAGQSGAKTQAAITACEKVLGTTTGTTTTG